MGTGFWAPVALAVVLSAGFLEAAGNDSPTAVAQQLFDAMKAHDSAAAMALFVPGTTMSSFDAAGKAVITPVEKWADHIGASKSGMLERMWNPKVMEQGSIATVWAEYDFHLDGTFSHCGIDSFTMLKTEAGWKIAGLSYTREKSCAPSPLGPPKAP
jgi:hypothetical protein